MKQFLLLIFTVVSFSLHAQTKNNTTIDKANTVNIYNGKVSIGQVNINPTLKPKFILQSVTQKKDTADTYKTTFQFSNPENLPFFNINVTLVFNKPIVKAFASFKGTAMNMGDGYKPDFTAYQYKASQVNADSFSIVVISKVPVFTTLYGIDGVAGQ